MPSFVRAITGVVAKDWQRYRRALKDSGTAYLGLCNRSEHLEPAPDGSGYRCDWRWTSDLHAPKYLPFLGQRLLRRAVQDHPIERRNGPEQARASPDVSFIIGHRG